MRREPDPARPATLEQWEAVFGSLPPLYPSLTFMQKALTYETQCEAMGGLTAKTRRFLRQIAAGEDVTNVAPPKLSTGAHLARE
jgi:hypothetical protein